MRRTGGFRAGSPPNSENPGVWGQPSTNFFHNIFSPPTPARPPPRPGAPLLLRAYFAATARLLLRYFNTRSQARHGAPSRRTTSRLDATWKRPPAPIQDGMK